MKPNASNDLEPASLRGNDHGDGAELVRTIDRSRIISVEPQPIPFADTKLKLWGDEASGWVNDWIYVSSEELFQIVFSLPPGKSFRHSETNRTVFAGDEVYVVLAGTLLLANPESGEVLRLEKGEAASFGPNTWHHGFNPGSEELRVLEFFAPPPAAGASQVYARTRPYLNSSTYVRDHLVGRWPEASRLSQDNSTLRKIGTDELLWRIEGQQREIAVGLLLSTPRLTVGRVELQPAQRSERRTHGGDLGVYVLEGRLNVFLPGDGEDRWFQIRPGDGFFAPAETPYEFWNVTETPVSLIFGVAPAYLPSTASARD